MKEINIKGCKNTLDETDMATCKTYENKKVKNKQSGNLKKKKVLLSSHKEESKYKTIENSSSNQNSNIYPREHSSCEEQNEVSKVQLFRKKKRKLKSTVGLHETSQDLQVIGKQSKTVQNKNTSLFNEKELEYKNKQCYVQPDKNILVINSKDGEEQETKKIKNHNGSSLDDYRPGMLSELLQKKKYGRLIIPWDPSFGLDGNYKIPESPDQDSDKMLKLKINPLFDLSKRKNQCSATEEGIVHQTVFVGNLPDSITVPKLKKMFRKCGLIVKVKLRGVQGHKEGNKQVCATVKFAELESCEAALKLNGKEFEGHHLRVTLADKEIKSQPNFTIFVGNIAFNAKDDDLWKTFQDCGEIDSVRIIRDSRSGKGKGFGYVNFKSADSVDHALKLNESLLLDRNIRVSRSSYNSNSLSNSDKIKRRNKKKKLNLRNKPESGKPTDKSEDDHKNEHDFSQSESDQIIKKVKKCGRRWITSN